jgi:hypothetical protein
VRLRACMHANQTVRYTRGASDESISNN